MLTEAQKKSCLADAIEEMKRDRSLVTIKSLKIGDSYQVNIEYAGCEVQCGVPWDTLEDITAELDEELPMVVYAFLEKGVVTVELMKFYKLVGFLPSTDAEWEDPPDTLQSERN